MVHEELVETPDGVSLWTATQGSGPPLLLCHGGPGLWDYLSPVAGMVDGLCTVHRYDQRGGGRSTVAGPYTVGQCLEDMETLRRHWGYERWLVGGHSWGAALSLAYAWAYPERVRALVYISGTGLGKDWRQAHREANRRLRSDAQNARVAELRSKAQRSAEEEREYLIATWEVDYVDRSTAVASATRFLHEGFAVNYECNRQLSDEIGAWEESDLVMKCGRIHVPVLVVHGELDPRPAWGTDSLVEALPNGRRVILDGAGHMPWVERGDALAEALQGFLREVAA
jgi:proline iminopeptidase